MTDAMLEIWQANAAGKYDHAEDRQEKPRDPLSPASAGRSPTRTAAIRFTTIRPGAVPGRGNALQAPHILISIFARGLLKHLVTRALFRRSRRGQRDRPAAGPIEERRGAPLAVCPARRRRAPSIASMCVLQGEGETVFFDL